MTETSMSMASLGAGGEVEWGIIIGKIFRQENGKAMVTNGMEILRENRRMRHAEFCSLRNCYP